MDIGKRSKNWAGPRKMGGDAAPVFYCLAAVGTEDDALYIFVAIFLGWTTSPRPYMSRRDVLYPFSKGVFVVVLGTAVLLYQLVAYHLGDTKIRILLPKDCCDLSAGDSRSLALSEGFLMLISGHILHLVAICHQFLRPLIREAD